MYDLHNRVIFPSLHGTPYNAKPKRVSIGSTPSKQSTLKLPQQLRIANYLREILLQQF